MQKISQTGVAPLYSGDVVHSTANDAEGLSDSGGLFDSYFATVVTTFATYGVVDVPCSAVGAESKSRGNGLVVCATFRCTGL